MNSSSVSQRAVTRDARVGNGGSFLKSDRINDVGNGLLVCVSAATQIDRRMSTPEPTSEHNAYKSYKSFVPRKWDAFDTPEFSFHNRSLSFAQFMPKNEVEEQALRRAMEKAAYEKAGLMSRKAQSKSGQWVRDMTEYCQKEEARRESVERSDKLGAALRVQQEQSFKRRERKLFPPEISQLLQTLGESSTHHAARQVSKSLDYQPKDASPVARSPSPFHTNDDSEEASSACQSSSQHPSSSKLASTYAQLLRVASDMHLADVRDKSTRFMDEKQRRVDEAGEKHLKRVDTQARQSVVERCDERHQKAREHDHRVNDVLKQHHDILVEKAITQQNEHERLVAREHALAQRRAEGALDLQRRMASRADALRERVQLANERKERLRNESDRVIQENLSHNNERREYIELMRHQKVERKEGEIAYARAMAHRQDYREKQLQRGDEIAKRVEQRAKQHQLDLDERVAEMRSKAEARESRVAQNLKGLEADREAAMETVTERAKSAVSMSPRSEPTSPTDSSYWRRRRLHDELQADRQRRDDERARANDAAIAAAAATNEQRAKQAAAQLSAKVMTAEQRRDHTFQRAAEMEFEHQQRVEQESAAKEKKIEQQLGIWKRQRDESRQERANQENERIASCLQAVNVEQRVALEAHVEELDRKRREHYEAQQAAFAMRQHQRETQRLETRKVMLSRVEADASRRQHELEERAKLHSERLVQVVVSHDQALHDKSQWYADRDRMRQAKSTAAAEVARLQSQRRLRQAREIDMAVEQRLDERQHELVESIESKRQAKFSHERDVVGRHHDHREEKLQQVEEKVNYVRQRATLPLEERLAAARSVSPPRRCPSLPGIAP